MVYKSPPYAIKAVIAVKRWRSQIMGRDLRGSLRGSFRVPKDVNIVILEFVGKYVEFRMNLFPP